MPIIRQNDPFLERQLIISALYLATYKTLRANKIELEEIIQLCEEIIICMLNSVSFLTKIITRKRLFSKNEIFRISNSAKESQEKRIPDNFVFEFIPGKDENNYKYIIKECAILKFYTKQNAEELMPTVCNLNKIFSQVYDFKLEQTKYLSKGDNHCNIRYSKIS